MDQDNPIQNKIVKGFETVLLVDDEKTVTEVGQALLEGLGYHVIAADGGKQALDIVRDKRDEIDLVILDMVMPDMNGEETFDHIRELQPKMPVVLTSGYLLDEEAENIMKKGCNEFLQKPFDLVEFSQTVRKVLDGTMTPDQG